MEPHDNKQLALLKAISAHEQAAAALADLMEGLDGETYAALLGRIEQNITALQRAAESSKPGDVV
jgi:hypothetical protein